MQDKELCLQEIGQRIIDRRKQLGLTQEALAEKIGVNREYISKIERGTANMSLKKIVNLTNFIGADIKDILKF